MIDVSGFTERKCELDQLSFNPEGYGEVGTYLVISFISFLFILLECLPVFVKLMSDRGPYDVALQNIEAVAIHNSEKEKDHEIIVTDHTLDTLNEAEIGKKKVMIERKVKKDLDEPV